MIFFIESHYTIFTLSLHYNIYVFTRELQELPSILFDHVDVTKILKDLIIMQRDISLIKEQYAKTEQLEVLNCEIQTLKLNSAINPQCNVNIKRGACLQHNVDSCTEPTGLPQCEVSLCYIQNNISSSETVYREISKDHLLFDSLLLLLDITFTSEREVRNTISENKLYCDRNKHLNSVITVTLYLLTHRATR